MDDRNLCETIRTILSRDARVRASWLFGSRARGEASPGSDIDVAVLMDHDLDAGEERLLHAGLTEALHRDDVDIVVLNHAPPLLRYEVVAAGRRLLARDELEADLFEERAVREYLDTAWLRRTQQSIARQALRR